VDQSDIKIMAKKIGMSVQAKRVYLIGSYARGTAHEQSDVDFVVIMTPERLKQQPISDVWHQARFTVHDSPIGVDILVFSESDWIKWQGSSYHILGTCQREGQLLYATG
jgi:predicted nucleotidyltransferase